MLLSLLLVGCPKQGLEPAASSEGEFAIVAWLNDLRRASNVHWQACLDRLPADTPLVGESWRTCAVPVIDSRGALVDLTIAESSGIPALDACVEDALRAVFPAELPPNLAPEWPGGPVALDFCYTVALGESGASLPAGLE